MDTVIKFRLIIKKGDKPFLYKVTPQDIADQIEHKNLVSVVKLLMRSVLFKFDVSPDHKSVCFHFPNKQDYEKDASALGPAISSACDEKSNTITLETEEEFTSEEVAELQFSGGWRQI
jgi:hypothetical protein